jgi:prolyl-tRNA synthetase
VLPPRLAPYQVVIVPIGRGEQAGEVASAAAALARRLADAGIRAHVDDRPQLSPGFKFNDWELRGVPIRLELGPRDLAAGSAVMARRLGDGKESITLEGAPARLADELEAFQAFLLERATAFRDERTVTTDAWDEFAAAVATGWARRHQGGNRGNATLRPARGGGGIRPLHSLWPALRLRQAGHLRPRVLRLPTAPCTAPHRRTAPRRHIAPRHSPRPHRATPPPIRVLL